MLKYCLIVPHYNHERQFLEFLPKLLSKGLPIIVIDDGSRDESLAALQSFVSKHENIHLVAHVNNRGKGAAVRSGFCLARSFGFTHVIQVDADGQHNIDDVEGFIAASQAQPQALICGKPTFDNAKCF